MDEKVIGKKDKMHEGYSDLIETTCEVLADEEADDKTKQAKLNQLETYTRIVTGVEKTKSDKQMAWMDRLFKGVEFVGFASLIAAGFKFEENGILTSRTLQTLSNNFIKFIKL